MQKQKVNLTNIIVIEGYLSTPVTLVREKEKKNIFKASFRLNNPCQIGRNTYNNDYYVVVYGKKAELLAHDLSEGDRCTVTGKSSLWFSGNSNGVARTGATIYASDVFYEVDEEGFER